MFIQASGKNKRGRNVGFIAVNPEEVLQWMRKEGIEESTVFPGPLDSDVIEIRHLKQEDVERWIRDGEI